MRATPLLLALLLAAASTAAIVPAASAKPYCTYGESGCDGLVCVYAAQACVDDCLFTCLVAPACVPLWEGPFSHAELCVDVSQAPGCAVYVDTHSMEGTSRRCYVLPDGAEPAAAPAAGCAHLVAGHGWDSYLCYDLKAEPTCMLWTETRWYEGGVSKSCIPNLPTDVPPGAGDILPAASGPACYDVYREYAVGPVTVIQRDSCTYEVVWTGESLDG